MAFMKLFPNDRRVNDKVNYVGLKPVKKKNYYALASDKKTKKSFLHNIENVTKLQAKNEGVRWARKEGLVFEGVYSN